MEQNRIRPTRSGLLAIELLIAVGIFSFCAAICVGLFVRAEVMSAESADLTRAVNEARSVAECFKAAGGDLGRTIELSDTGWTVDGALFQPYDGDWNPVSRSAEFSDAVAAPAFFLTLEPKEAPDYVSGVLSVWRGGEETPLLRWTVAALPEAAQ